MSFFQLFRELKQIQVDSLPWNQPPGKPFMKCARTAESCRKSGNEMFRKKNFEHALENYNESLCYAPRGSEDIPLAYGNRSAVYCEMGKYALALENIKLARENGFPADKKGKLDGREKKCKKLMEQFGAEKDFDASSFFKLSHPRNDKIPFIAGCLELRKCKKYGRGIYTTKDLKTGDIITIESPVFTRLGFSTKDPACFFCSANKSGSLIPCDHCTAVMFCSEECKQKAALIHPNERVNSVRGFTPFGMVLKMQLEAFRIAGGVNEMFKLLKDSDDKTIFDFDFSNPDDPSYEKNMLIALNGLSKNVDRGDLLNTSPINEKPRTAEERLIHEQMMKFTSNQYLICFSNMRYTNSSAFIFLIQSLLNHSCYPNTICVKFDKELVLMVTRPVKAGEQIFYSYLNPDQNKAERHEELKKWHDFTCDCEVCTNNWPQDFPKKDPSFAEPECEVLKPAEAIKQFKKNCEYIDKNAEKMPCYEVQTLMDHNQYFAVSLGGTKPPARFLQL